MYFINNIIDIDSFIYTCIIYIYYINILLIKSKCNIMYALYLEMLHNFNKFKYC